MATLFRSAGFALALVLIAFPTRGGTDEVAAPQRLDTIAEAVNSDVDPFAGGVDGEDEAPKVSVAGRLVLPWGRNDEGHRVLLALRNDSKQGPRAFKALFFDPQGEVVAVSKKLPLPPRGSAAFPVNEIIAEGAWMRGSIEILYSGPGHGRLYGSATQVDLDPLPQSETQHLVQAEFHVTKEAPDDDRR